MHIMEQFGNWTFYLFGAYPVGALGGLTLNIILAILSLSFSFFAGVLLGYSRLSRRKYVKIPCILYVDTVRSIPLILILFWLYFFLPYLLGKDISLAFPKGSSRLPSPPEWAGTGPCLPLCCPRPSG
jgi:His/Glu/Gln/Arg/opine family amino acid ABC transporter permease subunit